MKVVALIPARYGSTRFPGKPLALLRGKPMIQHVYECTRLVHGLAQVMVATDDERIAQTVRGFGGDVIMTRSDHLTGTDRLAEAAQRLDAEVIVNVQGDLPFFPPAMVEDAVAALSRSPVAAMSTVKTPIHELAEWRNPNVVKVVTDRNGYALYFSRSPIPFPRSPESGRSPGIPAYWSLRVPQGLLAHLHSPPCDPLGGSGKTRTVARPGVGI